MSVRELIAPLIAVACENALRSFQHCGFARRFSASRQRSMLKLYCGVTHTFNNCILQMHKSKIKLRMYAASLKSSDGKSLSTFNSLDGSESDEHVVFAERTAKYSYGKHSGTLVNSDICALSQFRIYDLNYRICRRIPEQLDATFGAAAKHLKDLMDAATTRIA